MTDVIQSIFKTCDRHAERLHWAMGKMQPMIPVTPKKFESLTPEEVSYLEVFTTRFSKLQDAMGGKLFPEILKLTEEPGEFPTFIDKLNALEKVRVLNSAEDWLMLRKVRNQFAHDYPDDSEQNSTVLNHAYQLAPQLLGILADIKKFVGRYS